MILPVDWGNEEVAAAVLLNEKTERYTEGKSVKKVIVVPKKIINVVVS